MEKCRTSSWGNQSLPVQAMGCFILLPLTEPHETEPISDHRQKLSNLLHLLLHLILQRSVSNLYV